MSARSVLIFDCYVELPGASGKFHPPTGQLRLRVCLSAHGGLPLRPIRDYDAIVVTGSAASVRSSSDWIIRLSDDVSQAVANDVPILGVCFGHLLSTVLGGRVEQSPVPEVGTVEIELLKASPLTSGLAKTFSCFVSHEDEVVSVGKDCEILAQSKHCAIQAQHRTARAYGIQFHPEMPAEECLDLLRYRAERHPSLEMDVDHIHASRVDQSELARCVFGNFLSMV